MAHMDIFKNKAFSMVEMLSAIDLMDYKPKRLQSMNLAEKRSIRTTSVSIEMRNEEGYGLIQTTPRGSELTKAGGTKRNIRNFETTRIGEFDTMYANEIQDIRAFGKESELAQVQQEIGKKMIRLDDDISLTEEHMNLGMIQGIVLDADGSEIFNWFDEMDVLPNAEVDFDFANSSLAELRQKCRDIKRRMERNSKGAMISGIHAMTGDDFYDKLVTHPEIEKTYLNQQEARLLRGDSEGDVFDMFKFGGITFENYRGTDDNSTVAIEGDKCKIFPSRSRGVFVEARAPGESFQVVNRPGRRRYAQLIRDRDRDEWVRVEEKTYPLHICQRPALLESGRA